VEAAAQIAGKSLGLNSPYDGTWWGRTWMERLKIWCDDKIFLETELPQLYFNDVPENYALRTGIGWNGQPHRVLAPTKSIMQITNGSDDNNLDYNEEIEMHMPVHQAMCGVFYLPQTPIIGTWPNVRDSNGNEHPVVPFFKRCIRIFTSPPFNMKFMRPIVTTEEMEHITDEFEQMKYYTKLPKNVTQDPNDTEEYRKRKEEDALREYMEDALKNGIFYQSFSPHLHISFVYPQFYTEFPLQVQLREEIKLSRFSSAGNNYSGLMEIFPSTPPFWHDLFKRANDAGRIHNSYPEVVNEDVPVSF
jgi:hypothetical protein